MSDDDNERDPFSFRYARGRTTWRPSTTTRIATSGTGSTRGRWSTLRASTFNTRVSARSAQPKSVGNTPQDRIQPDGSIVKRNTLRKDNEFFTLDLRISRPFTAGPA